MAVGISIVAFQSISPAKMTEPGRSRAVSIASGDELRPEVFGAHFRLVLYYRLAGEEESALAVAGWARETMSAALAEEPLLAGRLTRREGRSGWEVKFNDAGVRLVQASATATMEEFLAAGELEEREWKLVYWREVERENPQQSALFYVQVTEFQGDGYSIGISCSLLLADPLLLARFLRRWAEIHRRKTAAGLVSGDPIFHLSRFKRSPLPTHLAAPGRGEAAPPTCTLLFRLPSKSSISIAALAAGCAGEAAACTCFTFIYSDHSAGVTVEFVEEIGAGSGREDGAVEAAKWSDLDAGKMELRQGSAPVRVSYRIVPGGSEVVVLVMVPADISGPLVSVSVPLK
ncbi:hypothetical protein AXF42_Ash000998 [Apostasia shenzhenica]|uniref:Uncharacterized protein n=1 Tax=Apostasia shenzhenica TaxID=1088818 RepID=A0A2I0ATM8_9ASPA|nr:hypothetical protein AXF42_Ash000998 [Apostasia shenzhenica]